MKELLKKYKEIRNEIFNYFESNSQNFIDSDEIINDYTDDYWLFIKDDDDNGDELGVILLDKTPLTEKNVETGTFLKYYDINICRSKDYTMFSSNESNDIFILDNEKKCLDPDDRIKIIYKECWE